MPEVIRYDNEQAVENEFQLFKGTNTAITNVYIERMINNIRALYQKYGITTDTPFSQLNTRISRSDAKAINDDLYYISKEIEDSDLKRELKPVANMTQYDSIQAQIALGLGALFVVVSGNIAKQASQSEANEVKRLNNAYKKSIEYHTGLHDSFKPYLANHYIKAIYAYRSQFRTDLLAQRQIEHTVDKLQKEAIKLNNRNSASLIDQMTNLQLDAEIASIIKNGFSKYEIFCETGACKICLPYKGKVYDVKDYEPNVTAPKWHNNCRCHIFGAN